MVYIRDFLGHASIQTTEIYATVSQAILNKTLRSRKIPEFTEAELKSIKGNEYPDFLKKKKK
ncbi:hypothetical protein LBYZC6_28520 [Lacrimispora brassicae]